MHFVIFCLLLIHQFTTVSSTSKSCDIHYQDIDGSRQTIEDLRMEKDLELVTSDYRFLINLCGDIETPCRPAACGKIDVNYPKDESFKPYLGKPCKPYVNDPPYLSGRLVVWKLGDEPDPPGYPIPRYPDGTCRANDPNQCIQESCAKDGSTTSDNKTDCTASCAVLIPSKDKTELDMHHLITYDKENKKLVYKFDSVKMRNIIARKSLCHDSESQNIIIDKDKPITVQLTGLCDPTEELVIEENSLGQCKSRKVYYGRKCLDPGKGKDACSQKHFTIQSMIESKMYHKITLLDDGGDQHVYRCSPGGTNGFKERAEGYYSGMVDPAPFYKKQCYCIKDDVKANIDLDSLVSFSPNFGTCGFNITFLARNVCNKLNIKQPTKKPYDPTVLLIVLGVLTFGTVFRLIWYEKYASDESKMRIFICKERCCKSSIMFINCLRQDRVKAQYKAKEASRIMRQNASEMRERASELKSKISKRASMVSQRVTAVSKDVSSRFSRTSSKESTSSNYMDNNDANGDMVGNDEIEETCTSSGILNNVDEPKTVKIGDEEYLQLD